MTTTRTPRTPVSTTAAPSAIGPYSQAIRHGDVLYCSGQVPVDPADGTLVSDSPGAAATRCLKNLQAVCEAAGTELSRALRVTVYTTQLDRAAEINEAYAEFFAAEPPARAMIGVAALPRGSVVEIDALVAVD